MRQLVLSPRWIMWHLLTLGAMIACGLLAAWQWQRAGSAMGSALNVGYGLQWPVFAVFFGVMWWRMLRTEAAQLAEGGREAGPDRLPTPEAAPHVAEVSGAPVTAASPFGPRPAAAVAPPVDEAEDPELVAYNRMLADLAARSDR